MGDSFYKDMKIKKLEKKIDALEKINEQKEPKPYIPSYTQMETWQKGLYDGQPKK